MNVLLRKCTMKSILGFGRYDFLVDMQIQNLIETGKGYYLLDIYYKLAKIDFTDDVKKELGITKEREIKKPGKLTYDEAAVLIKLCYADYKSNYERQIMTNAVQTKKKVEADKLKISDKTFYRIKNKNMTNKASHLKRY